MSARFENDPEFRDAIPKPGPRRRFPVVEVLTVLGILAFLIAFMIPAPRTARGTARRMQCASNLKNIGLALHNYEQTYGALPPAYTVDANGRPLHSWRTLILPYLGATDLYQTIDLSKPWDDPANARARAASVGLYHCPEAAGSRNTTTYFASVGPNGCLMPGRPRRLAEITDARAATLMLIEAGEENAVPWMAPVDADEALVMALGSTKKPPHSGGMNACFVDGGVRFLHGDIPAKIRRALMTISGHDDPGADEF